MFAILKKKLKNNVTIKHLVWKTKAMLSRLLYTDKEFLFKKYRQTYGYLPNIECPKLFNEKLLWTQLNYRDDLYARCADKYAVRAYVQEKVGEKYLIKCLGIYRKWEEINLDSLPKSFVLKATHGSGWNFLCPDKARLNIKDCRNEINYWLSTNYYVKNREWNYKYIEPRVICEEFIGEESGTPPLDYKFYCFNGVVKFVQLCIDRYEGEQKHNIYDTDWKQIKNVRTTMEQDFTREYKKPEKWEEMLEISRKLSEDFNFVRVDLYYINNIIYFGELTFFPGGGIYTHFSPNSFHAEMGSWLTLPDRNIDVWNEPNIYID
ncbi:ATP-grasp fold amidoligase family protein [Dysgonomonas sp. Marseille-P4361]|uniref:ATP-grasp fold amidoligase family protein n=1 Tax=Dysgonomonas sp. Marseille-P4361 TaxID=2161820 RepID=UPI000D554158|nr:ATP-grasp fold amidoligase family protein [Dysgonomonas sp. Marseille-P4361]